MRVEVPHDVVQLPLALRRGVRDIEGPGEVLSQLVGGSHLQGFAVTGHRLAAQRVDRPGEAFPRRLAADEDRDRQHGDHQILVRLVQDPQGIGACVVPRGVRGVPFLPEELAGAQEEART